MQRFKINTSLSYLVGVSGGPDSMFMLNELIKMNVKDLVVCHVNYKFRNDSDNDQKIVEKFCEKNNLKLEKLVIEQDYSLLKENFESWARKIRYDFFVEVSKKHNIKNVLIAHNRNDLVETFLLQQERKSYVKHYGLNKTSMYKDLIIVRPMLNILKSEILVALKEEKVAYAVDSTNEDIKYKRNKIRAELSENSFNKIEKEINLLNSELEKISLQVDWYVNNNMSADELKINKNLQEKNLEFIQRTIYKWLEILKKDFIIQNRRNKTIFEIAKNIKVSEKVFWEINIGDFSIIKDYENLFLIKTEIIQPKTFVINSKQDLYLAEEFINWLDLVNAIKRNKENYPYVITNDFLKYKIDTYTFGKKTNRYLIDKKIRYKNRMLKAVVYSKRAMKILNTIK
ncbi:tRNA lysidine(34) synthetase TilS [Mesoplasma entomophilum]|uniref:tRNA(Ile)-lysidine synthase n=1 Tax=Mesoplasma entomophilum TaxID=2149 RepID=A0A3S5Y0I1_9MOLU|nr:tRNA lysidine(34) synthetase TilS [Mesoplasma entomophilum]ATQ35842.1 tRNA lysidine(34) synthetase TilS [Mesoplasma entomophilum]ATZ19814.1 tRNA(Ile)-lysidine synthase [Mesoplasma entomophilum]AVN60659.1 tRNA lysidine(34) synthetase TilS [Mesoplasma entomophilum]